MERWKRIYTKDKHCRAQVISTCKVPDDAGRRQIFQKNLAAQATLELAIFGAIIIMLLGILVNYGLRYNFQQQTMQRSFREGLATAAVSMNQGTPTATSDVRVRDKHIPNPTDTFGVGLVVPMLSSASVTRTWRMQETADNREELPHVVYNIQSNLPVSYTTAGFVNRSGVTRGSFERYQEIYGSSNVNDIGGWYDDDQASGEVQIIDYCAGEIMNYDSAVRQCRQIVDSQACKIECQRGGGKNCASTCSQPIVIPPYCADYEEDDPETHRYTFGALNRLFGFTNDKDKSMGVQNNYLQTTVMNNRLQKDESTGGIRTTDRLNWRAQTQRKLVVKPYGEGELISIGIDVTSTVSQNRTNTTQSNW